MIRITAADDVAPARRGPCPRAPACIGLDIPGPEGGNPMGKGDRKTARGKIWRGSHGKSRPKPIKATTATTKAGQEAVETPAPRARKATARRKKS